eukprot:m.212210 g.212210  ORF g.212210 m.212210 type:complete len:147 (-) comp33120_c5_seq1:597-1037(-)
MWICSAVNMCELYRVRGNLIVHVGDYDTTEHGTTIDHTHTNDVGIGGDVGGIGGVDAVLLFVFVGAKSGDGVEYVSSVVLMLTLMLTLVVMVSGIAGVVRAGCCWCRRECCGVLVDNTPNLHSLTPNPHALGCRLLCLWVGGVRGV